jgi:hypothetical protein
MEYEIETRKKTEHIGGARQASTASETLHPVLHLQQQAGNQAVQELLRSGVIQAKLAIGNPDDPDERAADNIAHTIMRAHAGFPASTPCACSHDGEMCDECQQKQAQPAIHRRASAPAAPSHVPHIVTDVLRSPGHPLDSASRAFFEPRFGHDFSHVRVHTGHEAAESARSINALAYATGSHIAFDSGQYAPQSALGRTLLAHELAHVVQRGNTQSSRLFRQPAPGVPDAGAPVAGAPTNPQPAPAQNRSQVMSPVATPQPTIKQGPIGDVIFHVGSWTFFQSKQLAKNWTGKLDETTLISVPIPDLGVRVGISGKAAAYANFTAMLGPGMLRNIQVGFSYQQAATLEILGLLGGELGGGCAGRDLAPIRRPGF